jgi:hypothetical protein
MCEMWKVRLIQMTVALGVSFLCLYLGMPEAMSGFLGYIAALWVTVRLVRWAEKQVAAVNATQSSNEFQVTGRDIP